MNKEREPEYIEDTILETDLMPTVIGVDEGTVDPRLSKYLGNIETGSITADNMKE